MMPWEHYSKPDMSSVVFALVVLVAVAVLIVGGCVRISGIRKR